MRETGAELGVVVAFGQLLPTALLDALPHGFVNVHFSLLPRWRGERLAAVATDPRASYFPLKPGGAPTTARAGIAFPGNDWLAGVTDPLSPDVEVEVIS